jgi:hypothetical protein
MESNNFTSDYEIRGIYSLIVVFLYGVDNEKTFLNWLLLPFKLVLVVLLGAT